MKIKCIDTSQCMYITYKKIYEVVDEDTACFCIRHNKGELEWYPKNRFEEVTEEVIYDTEALGIRKNYLYQFDASNCGIVIGEILNCNCATYVVRSYDKDGYNHYIIKYSDIRRLTPYMSVEKFNNKEGNHAHITN